MVCKIYYSKIISIVAGALFLGLATPVLAATLSLTPATGTYTVGGLFTTTVVVTSSDKPANALSGLVTFPTDRLEVGQPEPHHEDGRGESGDARPDPPVG